MDAETIRLVITASAAVIAGLGGAGITGWINRRNTTATLEAARQTNEDQWRRTRERDHEVWLRDNRQEAYVAFFDEAETIHGRVSLWPTELVDYKVTERLQAQRARIRLIGALEVRARAKEVAVALGKALIARNKLYRATLKGEKEREKALADDWRLRLSSVREALQEFSVAVRLDLGTASEEQRARLSPPEDLEKTEDYTD